MKAAFTTLALLLIVFGSPLLAGEKTDLTTEEMARTASFVFKAELALGDNPPFEGPGSYKNLVFLKNWLKEDIAGMGETHGGRQQKERMAAFVKNLDILGAKHANDVPDPKFKGKGVKDIALIISADLREIASVAGLKLDGDKEKAQNN